MATNIVPFAEKVCQNHLGVQHILVMRHGALEASFHFQPTDRRSDFHSATKSVVSLATGMAIHEGLTPGTHFVYNNSCPHLIARMISETSGQNLIDWLRPRLFEPLEIRNPQWYTDPLGYTCGPGGVQVTTEEFLRLGQLCLQKGNWKGRQLVPESYIQEASSLQIATWPDESMKNINDNTSGYGYFFWKTKRDNGFYFSGWGGQLCIILPSYDAVVCMKSYEFNTQALMDAVWETIVAQW